MSRIIIILLHLFTHTVEPAIEMVSEATSGTLSWRYLIGDPILSSPAVASDGTLYIGSLSGLLYSITSYGVLKWSFPTGSYISQSSPVIGVDGTIYIGSSDYYFYAINVTGHLKWRCFMQSMLDSSPAIGMDGTLFIGTRTNYLYAITSSGDIKWRYEMNGPISSSPSIDSKGIIYIASHDSYLYAITSSGNLRWRNRTGDEIWSSPVISSDGTSIYIGSDDKCLYAFRSSNGHLQWKYATSDWIRSSPVVGSDGTIYVGSYDTHIYAINAHGQMKWRFPTNNYVQSSPKLGADGFIYVGSDDSYAYAINPLGELQWRYKTASWVLSTPAVGSDGTVYFGSGDGYFYAVTGPVPTSSPTVSPTHTVFWMLGQAGENCNAVCGMFGTSCGGSIYLPRSQSTLMSVYGIARDVATCSSYHSFLSCSLALLSNCSLLLNSSATTPRHLDAMPGTCRFGSDDGMCDWSETGSRLFCPCHLVTLSPSVRPTISPTLRPTTQPLPPSPLPSAPSTIPTAVPTIKLRVWIFGRKNENCNSACASVGGVCIRSGHWPLTLKDFRSLLAVTRDVSTCTSYGNLTSCASVSGSVCSKGILQGTSTLHVNPEMAGGGYCYYGTGIGDCVATDFSGFRFCPCAVPQSEVSASLPPSSTPAAYLTSPPTAASNLRPGVTPTPQPSHSPSLEPELPGRGPYRSSSQPSALVSFLPTVLSSPAPTRPPLTSMISTQSSNPDETVLVIVIAIASFLFTITTCGFMLWYSGIISRLRLWRKEKNVSLPLSEPKVNGQSQYPDSKPVLAVLKPICSDLNVRKVPQQSGDIFTTEAYRASAPFDEVVSVSHSEVYILTPSAPPCDETREMREIGCL